jgi:transposase InsO family protein
VFRTPLIVCRLLAHTFLYVARLEPYSRVKGTEPLPVRQHRRAPLTHALHRVSEAHTARQGRHLAYIAEFTSDLRHVAGERNVVADALSRPPAAAVAAVAAPAAAPPLDWADIARDQEDDPSLEGLKKDSALKLEEVTMGGHNVWCDVSAGVIRPVIPIGHRERVFSHVHGLAHPGTRATVRLLSQRYVWRGMAKDATAWCRQCEACQRAKVTTHVQTAVEKIPIPTHRFSHVHVDLVGPWPPSPSGHTHLLTIIDRSTRWFEAIPLSDTATEPVLDAFVHGWLARFGVPARLTTDRGPQFTSSMWADFCQAAGIQHITTTAYHPQANRMVERLHRQLKDALRARAGPWWQELPYAALGLRAAPKDESNISAAEAALGQRLVLPCQAMPSEAVPPAAEPPPRTIPAASREFPGPNAAAQRRGLARWAYVRRGAAGGGPLAANYDGPYRVLTTGKKTCRLKIGSRVETVSVDRLKMHAGRAPPTEGQPKRRGRPPRSADKD